MLDRRMSRAPLLALAALALAAARALMRHSKLDPKTIAREAMTVAAEICIYTNGNIRVEALG